MLLLPRIFLPRFLSKMPTLVSHGHRVEEIELLDLFPAPEGEIVQVYGKIGNGKTATGTMMVLEALSKGKVVYTNWHIEYHGFDQRNSLVHVVSSLLFPWRNRLYHFPKSNLRRIEVNEEFLDNFEKITDAEVHLDEGHTAFDSYEQARMSLKKRMSVLHTRHFNRTIVIYSQRPSAIHVTMRANVNVFYKCQKVLSWPFLVFKRTRFEDLDSRDLPDESLPSGVKYWIGTKRILNAYNSQYLRDGVPKSQHVAFEAFELTYKDRIASLVSLVGGVLSRLPGSRIRRPGRRVVPTKDVRPSLKDLLPKA